MAREQKRDEERQTHGLFGRLLAVDLRSLHQPCFFSPTSSGDNLGFKPSTTRGRKGFLWLTLTLLFIVEGSQGRD